MFFEQQKQN